MCICNVCVCVWLSVCVCALLCVCVCLCVIVCVCMCVCVCVCTCVCVYVCLYLLNWPCLIFAAIFWYERILWELNLLLHMKSPVLYGNCVINLNTKFYILFIFSKFGENLSTFVAFFNSARMFIHDWKTKKRTWLLLLLWGYFKRP